MDSGIKRICLVIPSLGPGGMERVMSELAGYFDQKEKTEIHLILYGRTREMFYSVPSSIIVHKPEFVFRNNRRTFHTIKTLFFLRKKIRSIEPHVILSFGEEWNNLVLLSHLGLSYPIYVSDRAEPGLKRKWVQELLTKWLYRKASGIIVQTNIAKKIYEKHYPQKNIVSIGNPIRKVLGNSNSQKRENIVLSVGRLIDTKHFDLLIKIFAEIEAPEWKLVIVGGDSQRQNGKRELQNLINELQLHDRIVLTGEISNVEDYYNKSRIFAFTSSSEGFPNVIGEAMSAGLPVIAFDCVAGPSDLIADGVNGYLIPLFDTDKFEEKLKKLMKNEHLRETMGKQSLSKIKNFSINRIGEQFFNFILNQE